MRSGIKRIRKIARELKGKAAPEDLAPIFETFGIPVNQRTVGYAIVVSTADGAMRGDKDARRDFLDMIGESVRSEELKLKQKEMERKDPQQDGAPTVFEQMVRELYERAD